MTRKREHVWVKDGRSHEELIEDGFSLQPERKKKQCKDCITNVETGKNGRRYFKDMKMTKSEKKIFSDADKRKKGGKEILYSFEPFSLVMKLSVDVKKDKQGNVYVNIKQAKKGYCHKWDCPKKVKKNYSLCKDHLKVRRNEIPNNNKT